MANVNVNLTAALAQVFNLTSNLFEVNEQLGTITLPATASFYNTFQQVAISPGTIITLPATTVWFALVKNLNAAGGATIAIQQTAAAGTQITAAQSLLVLPGGLWAYVNPVETTGGLTGLTLISSSGTSTALVLLGS